MAFVGSWKMDTARSEDGVKFSTDVVGVPADEVAKMDISNTIEKIEDIGGGRYGTTFITPGFPEKSYEFAFGQQTDVETPIGLKYKCAIVDNGGGQYTDTTVDDEGRTMVTVRKFSGNECTGTSTIGDTSMKFVMVKL